MLSTKIRTIIITLVAAFSFTGASVLPAVSQASKNTGAYKASSESAKSTCHIALEGFNEALVELRAAQKAGDKQAIKESREAANEQLGIGWEAGCAWATARELPPERLASAVETPVVVTQGSPEALPPVQSITVTPARATAP